MSSLRIGFNTRVSFTSDAGPAAGLRDGITLFQHAESLGYQGGWAYQRHFDHYLSSPLPFFSAVGQHTSQITLGTAVLPARYQEPVLLAEAAATTDLLVDGRLQLALSSGGNQFDAVFGPGPTGLTGREEGQRRLAIFLSAIQGDLLHTVTEQTLPGPPVGSELRVTPFSAGLRSRIWYGSGHIASAVLAAQQGLRLITGSGAAAANPMIDDRGNSAGYSPSELPRYASFHFGALVPGLCGRAELGQERPELMVRDWWRGA